MRFLLLPVLLLLCAVATEARAQGGTITVTKVMPVLGDPGLFNIVIDMAPVAMDVGNGDSVQVPVGIGIHSVGETAGTNTNLAQYTTVLRCVLNGMLVVETFFPPQDVQTNAGDDLQCTLTNTLDEANTLELIKVTDPPGDTTTAFPIRITKAADPFDEQVVLVGEGATQVTIPSGTGYAVEELVPAGWSLVDVTCERTDGVFADPLNFEVDPERGTRCTFTNRLPQERKGCSTGP